MAAGPHGFVQNLTWRRAQHVYGIHIFCDWTPHSRQQSENMTERGHVLVPFGLL